MQNKQAPNDTKEITVQPETQNQSTQPEQEAETPPEPQRNNLASQKRKRAWSSV